MIGGKVINLDGRQALQDLTALGGVDDLEAWAAGEFKIGLGGGWRRSGFFPASG